MASPVYSTPDYDAHLNTDTVSMTVPNVVSGDLIIFSVCSKQTSAPTSTPSGFTTWWSQDNGAIYGLIMAKVADGTESGNTIDVVFPNAVNNSSVIFKVSQWEGTLAGGTTGSEGDDSVNIFATTANPDFGAISPAWGSADNLYIAMLNFGDDDAEITTFPSTFTDNNQIIAGAGGGANTTAGTALSFKQATSSSEDPSAYTLEESELIIGLLVAIRPGSSGASGDTTAPTLPSGSTITKGTILHDRFTVSFPKAADETTAEANLVYKLFVSDQNDLDTDVATVEANGVEVASGTDVTQLTSSDLSALGSPFNPGDSLYTVVVAYDEAGNGVIYDQVEITLQAIYGNVTRNSSAVENADVAIFTVDGPHLGNPVHVENASTDVNGDYWMSTEYDGTNNYWATVLFLEQSYTGTAESGTSNTLTDDIAQFTTDEFNDGTYLINLTGGTGSGQSRIILSNTADTVTVEYNWSVTPDATTEYEIGRIFSTSSNYHASKQ